MVRILTLGCSRVQEAKAQGIMVPFEGFRAEFESRVTSIGHLLAMMAPWDCPVYVTRVLATPLHLVVPLRAHLCVSLCWQLPHTACTKPLPLLPDATHTGN